MTNDADMGIMSWGVNGFSITNSTCQDLDNSNPLRSVADGVKAVFLPVPELGL